MAKYTDINNNLVYDNILKPTIKLGKDQVIGGDYKFNNNDKDIEPGSPIINAIDINWGSVILNFLSGTTKIYTTSDLLKYIQTLNNTIESNANKIQGIKIKDKQYIFDETGYAHIDDIIGNISIKVSSSSPSITPDEDGIIDLSEAFDNVNELIESGITDSIQSINKQINIHTASINALENKNLELPDWVATPNWDVASPNPGCILNKPDIVGKAQQTAKDYIISDAGKEVINTNIHNYINSDSGSADIRSIIEPIINNLEPAEGKNGLSAYEIAIFDATTNYNRDDITQWPPDNIPPELEYLTSTSSWIDSLTGATGPKGDPGNSISIKSSEDECATPGDSYIINNNGEISLNVYQGTSNTGEKVWQDFPLNINVMPGSPPIIDNDGYWNWWEYNSNGGSYIKEKDIDNNVHYGPFSAKGDPGTPGLDAYSYASSNYYTTYPGTTVEFPGIATWYGNFLPKINSDKYWYYTDPYNPTKQIILEYWDSTSNATVYPQAVGEPGDPGKSPRISATTIDNRQTYVWEIYDDSSKSYIIAKDPNLASTDPNYENSYVIAQGVDGNDGRDLKLNLTDISDFIFVKGYVIKNDNDVLIINSSNLQDYDPVNGYIAISVTPDNLNNVSWSESLTKNDFEAFLKTCGNLQTQNSEEVTNGVYYINKTNTGQFELLWAGRIEGENGVSGKSAYEIALDIAIEEWKTNHPNEEYPGTSVFEDTKYQTEQTWINSLQATVSDEVKESIVGSVIASLDITINDVKLTGSNGQLSGTIYGTDIQISSTNASTISEKLEDVSTLTETLTENIGTTINTVNSLTTIIGFSSSELSKYATLKQVIDELMEPGTDAGIKNSILDSLANNLSTVDIIIPTFDTNNTGATTVINVSKTNYTADLSNLVSGIKYDNILYKPATGIIEITSPTLTWDGQNITASNGSYDLTTLVTNIKNNIKNNVVTGIRIIDASANKNDENYPDNIPVATGTVNIDLSEFATIGTLSNYATRTEVNNMLTWHVIQNQNTNENQEGN